MKLVRVDTITADYEISLKDIYDNFKKEYPQIKIFFLKFENLPAREQIRIHRYKEIPTIEKEPAERKENQESGLNEQ